MSMYFDLHRHDEFSTFDGFGKPKELAKHAKSLGYKALGSSNHGNTNGLIKHYLACKAEGIKPILGVEAYHLPVLIEKQRGFHLCLFAKNAKGFENINTMQYIGSTQKYYNPIITFKELEEYSEGVICTSACIGGFIPQALDKGNFKMADKAINKFKQIFGSDFYIEIQPYKIDDEGTQENVNELLLDYAEKHNVKCILTSDSHYGSKEDFPTYMKMHEIAKHGSLDIGLTYGERYMPTEKEIAIRFMKMHIKRFNGDKDKAKKFTKNILKNMQEIYNKIDDDIFAEYKETLPVFDDNKDSKKTLYENCVKGLKARNKTTKEYKERLKEELEVINYHKFADYFLMVEDYTNWAKSNKIAVGPARGSGCNSLVNYALNITTVDPIKFGLSFSRFMSKEKNKMPDIDLDFETLRRPEVIRYLLEKYPENSAQICSYGLYKVDNLINDLVKVCGVNNEDEKKLIKKLIRSYKRESEIDLDALSKDPNTEYYNSQYDDIMLHFSKLYKKVRFIGTHAAGVAITGESILKFTALKYDEKNNKMFTAYDLNDLEEIKAVKFDILGLVTMQSIGELREMTGNEGFNEHWLEDEKILKAFREIETDGVFQYESTSAKGVLSTINVDCFDDVCAASAMNRPGPLSLGMPETYGANKADNSHIDTSLPYAKYLEETYGTVVYQEQIQTIAVEIGGLSWNEAAKIMKMSRGGTEKAQIGFKKNYEVYVKKFTEGAIKHGMTEEQAIEIFDKFFNYAFNKGHATGYAVISVEEMYYKIYHPTEFWYTKLKYATGSDEAKKGLFSAKAVKGGTLIFLPHVNYSSDWSIRKIKGDKVIQAGLISLKGVGPTAAKTIEEERKKGPFISYDDFIDRCKGRSVNKGVIEKLVEEGALEFNKKIYLQRVEKYNSALYTRGL